MSQAANNTFSVYKKDGIIYCVIPANSIVDTEAVKGAIEKRIAIAEGISHPILIDARDVKYWTLESRKYSLSKEAHQCVKAYGILINSSIMRIIINWAIKIFPHSVPQKIFTSEEDAIRWLNQFKDRNERPSKPILVF